MAEFCLECWRKMNNESEDDTEYVLSEELDLCEGCGEWKHVIIMERNAYYMPQSRYFMLFLDFFSLIWEILKIPYEIYKERKRKSKDS